MYLYFQPPPPQTPSRKYQFYVLNILIIFELHNFNLSVAGWFGWLFQGFYVALTIFQLHHNLEAGDTLLGDFDH